MRSFVHIHSIVQPHYETDAVRITVSYKQGNGNFKRCFLSRVIHLGRARERESGN